MAAKKAQSQLQPAAPATPELSPSAAAPAVDNVDLLDDLPLTMSIELGRTRATVAQAVELGEQSLIELDKGVGAPVDLLLNGRLFARGEVITVGENFGVRITEIVGQARKEAPGGQ